MGEITLVKHVMVSFQSLLQQAKYVSSQSRNVRFPSFFFKFPNKALALSGNGVSCNQKLVSRVFQSVLRYTGIPTQNPACHVHAFPIFWLKPFCCIGSYMLDSEDQVVGPWRAQLRSWPWFCQSVNNSSIHWETRDSLEINLQESYVETIYVLRKFPWTSSKHLTNTEKRKNTKQISQQHITPRVWWECAPWEVDWSEASIESGSATYLSGQME